MIRLEMKNCNMILIEKLQKYQPYHQAKLISISTWSNQKQVTEQAKFTDSPYGKAFEKQIKTTEDQGERQVTTIQNQGETKTIKKCL